MKGFAQIILVISILRGSMSINVIQTPWLPTLVLDSWFANSIKVSSVSALSLFRVSRLCESFSKCTLFCQENDSSFSFWRMLADPFLGENEQGVTKKCWTRQLRGNFVPHLTGVTISGSSIHWLFTERKASNLMDGVYNSDDVSTAFFKTQRSYFLIDLGQKFYLKAIKLYPLYGNSPRGRFSKISVRLGNTRRSGHFTDYTEVGYFDIGETPSDFVFTTDVNSPMQYRYVSVQSMTLDELVVGHVQIYTQTDQEYQRAHQKYVI